jgi:hypothetical protein
MSQVARWLWGLQEDIDWNKAYQGFNGDRHGRTYLKHGQPCKPAKRAEVKQRKIEVGGFIT